VYRVRFKKYGKRLPPTRCLGKQRRDFVDTGPHDITASTWRQILLFSSLRPPSLAVPTLLLPLPPQLFERSGDAALIGGANAGGLKAESMAADFADCYAGFGFNIFADVIFPGIGALIAIVRPHACNGRTDLAMPPKPALLTFFTFLAFGFIIIVRQNFSKVTVQISIFDWMV
jgi:hypothetical protein